MRAKPLTHVIMSILLIALFFAAGCSSTPRHTTALDNAYVSYAQAKANPLVTANAPVRLYEAEQSLKRAENADNEKQQRHYAYLAQKQSEQAVYEANQKASQKGIAQAGEERQQVQLQASREQTASARTQAEVARQQAQTAEQRAMTAERRAREAQEQQVIAAGQAQAAREQAQLARQQSAQLENQLSELKATQTRQGNILLTLSDVMFETNQAALKAGAMLSLNRLADILIQNPNEKVYIEGHTDNTGSSAYNEQLSNARANTVRQALIERGVSSDRIMARGMGESFPVASNNTQAGRQLNRRVDIIVTG